MPFWHRVLQLEQHLKKLRGKIFTAIIKSTQENVNGYRHVLHTLKQRKSMCLGNPLSSASAVPERPDCTGAVTINTSVRDERWALDRMSFKYVETALELHNAVKLTLQEVS